MSLRLRKNWRIAILCAAAALFAATGVVYALFTSAREYSFDMDSKINASLSLTQTGEGGAVTLTNPGDRDVRNFTVTNTSETDVALGYGIELSVPAASVKNTDALILWADGEIAGNLHQLLTPDGEGNYTCSVPFSLPLAKGESRTHEIAFEYHIGAGGGTRKIEGWTATAVGRTDINVKKYLFVSSAEELVQIARQNARGKLSDRTIYLTQDIALSSDLAFSGSALALDLNGRTLSGGALRFEGTGVMRILSSRAGGKLSSSLTVKSAGGLVLCAPALLSAPMTTPAYSAELALSELKSALSGMFGEGAVAGEYQIPAEFTPYAPEITSASARLSVADNKITVAAGERTETIPLALSVGGAASVLPVSVYGRQEDLVQTFLKNNAPYLVSALTSPLSIEGDIFLPTLGREMSVTARWVSKSPEILSASGKCYAVAADTPVRLIAIVSGNGVTATASFSFNVRARDASRLLKEFAQINAPQFDSVGQTRTLPGDENELAQQYLITEIRYTVPDSLADTLKLDETGKILTLIKPVSEDTTFHILLTAKVNGAEHTVEMPVYVSVTGSVSMVSQAHDSVLGKLSERTDKLSGIELPDFYSDVSISYTLVSETTPEELQGEWYRNPVGASAYVRVEGNKITLLPHLLPLENTVVYLKAEYRYGNADPEYYPLELTVAGVVHNDGEGIEDFTLYSALCAIFDDGDWILTRDEIDAKPEITSFTLNNTGVKSVKGLEFFPQFESVDLSDNQISDVSALAECYTLKTLKLANNKLLSIDAAANMPLLEVLDVSGNQIPDLSVLRSAAKLSELNLSGNTAFVKNGCGFLEELKNLAKLNLTGCFNFSETNGRALRYSVLRAYQNYLSAHAAAPVYTVQLVAGQRAVEIKESTLPGLPAMLTLTQALSGISEVYRVGDVIYLPSNLTFGGETFRVNWQEDSDGIVKITADAAGWVRAVVTRPDADKKIELYATLTSGSAEIRRTFTPVAVSGDSGGEIMVELPDGTQKPAAAVFPDPEFRYFVLKTYNTDGDRTTLSQEELNTASVTELSPISRGIESVEGIQYLTNLRYLNLSGNAVIDLSVLSGCANLSELILKDAEYDFSQVRGLTQLSVLRVYGSYNASSAAAEESLFVLFSAKDGIKIYKDGETEIWDPYKDFLQKQLTYLEDMLVLGKGESLTLPGTKTAVMYPGTDAETEVPLTFAYASKNLSDVTLSGTTLTLTGHPAYDVREQLYVKISRTGYTQTPDIAKYISVLALADYGVLVEIDDAGSTAKLHDRVSDPAVLKTLLGLSGGETVTREMLASVTALEFSGESNTELKGLELFSGLNLKSLKLTNFHPVYEADGKTRAEFSFTHDPNFWKGFPKLKTITFNRGTFSLFDFNTLALSSLKVENSLWFDMDKTDPTGARASAFSEWDSLTSVDLSYNNISDFWAVGALKNASVLYLYGNPASKTVTTDFNVLLAYQNLIASNPGAAYDYQVAEPNLLWSPDNREMSLNVTDGAGNIMLSGAENSNVVSPGDTLTLPSTYVYTEVAQGSSNVEKRENPLIWTSSAPETVSIQTAADGSVTAQVASDFSARALVVLTGRAEGIGKKLEYYFLADGAAGGAWDSFLAPNTSELEDPWFAHLVLSELEKISSENLSGIYTPDEFAKIPSLTCPDSIIESIRGVSLLTGLTSLDLSANSIEDISEIADLVNLTEIRLQKNKIKTLWITGDPQTFKVNESGEEDAAGTFSVTVTNFSVFNKLENLSLLFIYDNPQIEDYGAVSFTDDRYTQRVSEHVPVQKKIRPGLENLREVSTYPYPIQDVSFGTGNAGAEGDGGNDSAALVAENPFNYVSAWLSLVKTGGNYPKGTKFCYYEYTETGNFTAGWKLNAILDACKALDDFDVNPALETLSSGKRGAKVSFLGGTVSMNALPTANIKNYKVPSSLSGFITVTNGRITKVTGEVAEMNHEFYLIAVVHNSIYRLIPMEFVMDATAGASWNVEITAGFYRPAEEVFPDDNLRSYVFTNFAHAQKTLTLDSLQNKNQNSLILNNRGIRDIRGLDFLLDNIGAGLSYGPTVKSVNLSHNAILEIPAMNLARTKTFALDLTGCKALRSLEEFAPSFGQRVSELNLTNCKGLPSSQLEVLSAANCPNLSVLTLSGINISDFSFLTRLNKDKLTKVEYTYATQTAPSQLLLGNNLRWITELFLTTTGGTGTGLDTQYFTNFGESNARLFGEYLYLPSSFDRNAEIWLPLAVEVYGKTYGIEWNLPADGSIDGIARTETVDGKDYFVFSMSAEFTAETLSLYPQLTYNGTLTHKELVKLQFGTGGETGETLLMDAEVQFEANGAYEPLKKYVTDPVMRYYILKAYSAKNLVVNGQINHTDFASLKSIDFGEYWAYKPNFSSGNGVYGVINSLDGLEKFSHLTEARFYAINGKDFSAVASLTTLNSLTIYMCEIEDFSFLLPLKKLTSLDLYGTEYPHLAFLADLGFVQSVSNVAAGSDNRGLSSQVKNALAYSRVFGELVDRPNANTNAPVSRDDEKIGAIVLDRLALDWDFVENSYYLIDSSVKKTLTVPTSVEYNGKTAMVTVRAVSAPDTLTVTGNTVTFGSSSVRAIAAFVVRAEYDGGCYERYFETHL